MREFFRLAPCIFIYFYFIYSFACDLFFALFACASLFSACAVCASASLVWACVHELAVCELVFWTIIYLCMCVSLCARVCCGLAPSAHLLALCERVWFALALCL